MQRWLAQKAAPTSTPTFAELQAALSAQRRALGGGGGPGRRLHVAPGAHRGSRVAASTLARMVNFSSAPRVFVAPQPTDLRGRFNQLFALPQTVLQQDPLSGHWFVFTNRDRPRLKILFWDGSGWWVCAKRLEKGRFTWPRADQPCARLRGEERRALPSGLEGREKAGGFRPGAS